MTEICMRRLIALSLGLSLLAGCSPTDDEAPPESTEDGSPDVAQAEDDAAEDPAGGDASVSIRDFRFDPETVSVTVGDTVTWTHEGDITHNVTAQDGSFASGDLVSGETFAHTFETAGAVGYVCTLHRQMIATVEVSG
jgi:plastocyanin